SVSSDHRTQNVFAQPHRSLTRINLAHWADARLVSQNYVFSHRHFRHDHQLLKYRGNTSTPRISRRFEGYLLAPHEDPSSVRTSVAGQYFNERRFSCTVLAYECVNLACSKIK